MGPLGNDDDPVADVIVVPVLFIQTTAVRDLNVIPDPDVLVEDAVLDQAIPADPDLPVFTRLRPFVLIIPHQDTSPDHRPLPHNRP
jgi:hypothetical protein